MKYLGIDWATKHHVVALVDDDGEGLGTWSVKHTWAAVRGLLEQLEEHGGPQGIRIAMEPGAWRLRDALRVAGYRVYEVNPMRSDRFRDRFSPAGAKDDRRDALVLAHAVRTDERWLRAVCDVSGIDEELRLRCRDRLCQIDHRRRMQQQLAQTLSELYEAILAIGLRLTSPFILALIRAYPGAQSARRCRRSRLERLIREHRIRRVDADALYAILRTEGFALSDAAARAYADRTGWLMKSIAQISASIDGTDAAIDALFDQHPVQPILESVPGIGRAIGPYIAAEIATSLGPAPDAPSLRAFAGTCPITKKSGKQKRGYVGMRHGCHRRMQGTLYTIAQCSVRSSPWAKAYYEHQRARGAPHNTALRALSNKWMKIIATLMQRGETYDEQRHQNALRRAGVPWAPKLTDSPEKAA